MKRTIYTILDFFLPRYCPGCNNRLNPGESSFCGACLDNVLHTDSSRIDVEFERKFEESGYIHDFYAPYVFESDGTLQNIIYSVKYNKKFRTGVMLGYILSETLKDRSRDWEVDLIIPVPLHHLKKAERGFNQSDFIAKGLSDSLKIPASNKTLKRIRFTESQTKLTVSEREQNVSGAFRVKRKRNIRGKNILLVDDVITTGATVNECAKMLIENGANEIFACSVAVAD